MDSKVFKKFFLTLLLLLSVFFVVLFFTVVLPIHREMVEHYKKELVHEAQINALHINEIFKKAVETARQVTSRTKAREALESYSRGEITLDELKQFATPILRDALDRSSMSRTIVRFDRSGNPVVKVGLDLSDSLITLRDTLSGKSSLAGPFYVEDDLLFSVVAKIRDREGEFQGSDLLYFRGDEISQSIKSARFNGEEIAAALVSREKLDVLSGDSGMQSCLKALESPYSETKIVVHDVKGELLVLYPMLNQNWLLALTVDAESVDHIIHSDLRSTVWLFFGLMILVFIAIVLFFIRPLARSHTRYIDDVIDTNSFMERESKSLRELIEMYSSAEELALAGSWRWDSETHEVFWSDGLYLLHGLEPQSIHAGSDELLTLSLSCYREEDREKIKSTFMECCEWGVSYSFEIPFTSLDGTERFIRSSATALIENEKVIEVVGSIVDITAIHQCEEEAVDQQHRFESIFQSAPVGLLLLDRDTIVTNANGKLGEMVLSDPANIIGKRGGGGIGCVHSTEDPRGCGFGHGCSNCILRNSITSVVKENEHVVDRDIKLDLMINGSVQERWLRINAEPVVLNGEKQVFVAIADITESKQMAELVAESELKYRQLFNNLTVGVSLNKAIYDDEGEVIDFQFVDINPALEKMIGVTADQMVGKRMFELYPEIGTFWLDYQRRALLGEKQEPYETYSEELGKWLEYMIFSPRPGYVASITMDITDRKQAQHDIEAQKEFLATVVNTSSDGMWVTDMDGFIVSANEKTFELYGYNKEEIIGMHASQIAIDSPEQVAHTIEQLMLKKRIRFENQHKTKNGTLLDVDVTLSLSEQDETQIVASLRDITQQKKQERFLMETQRIAAIGTYELDIVAGKWEASDTLAEMFGVEPHRPYSIEEWSNLIHPEDRQMMTDYFTNDVLGKRESFSKDYRIVNQREGSVHWVFGNGALLFDEKGNPIQMIGTIQDVTSIKEKDIQLRKHESSLSEAQLLAHLGSWELDNESNTLHWSDEVYRIFEIEQSDSPLTYEQFLDAIHPDDREKVDKVFQTSLLQKKNYEVDHRLRMRDGRVKYVHERGKTLFDDEGKAINTSGTIQDITAKVIAEQEAEKLRGQLYQSQKMEAVGQLAGGVAHDFNNMLGVIIGHSEELLLDITETDPLHESIEEILQAAERSAALTRQLLAFSRKQVMQPKQLDLNDTVEGMLKMLRRLMGERITMHWTPSSETAMVYMDPGQIDQILANLCVNARDAMGGSGDIIIGISRRYLDTEYCRQNPVVLPGDYVEISVQDFGEGMDKKVLSQIFEPFFTTKEVGKGTGLGLSTVFGIVHQNAGTIEVESTPGEGTTFKMYIPFSEVQQDKSSAKTDEVRKLMGNGETIMIVEDEVMLLKAISQMLERSGYRTIPVNDPKEALEQLADTDHIDLLITDVIMPEMNGHDLSQHVRTMRPDIAVLFMSGYTGDVMGVQGQVAEGDHFIHKPFSFNDLLKEIRKSLDD